MRQTQRAENRWTRIGAETERDRERERVVCVCVCVCVCVRAFVYENVVNVYVCVRGLKQEQATLKACLEHAIIYRSILLT